MATFSCAVLGPANSGKTAFLQRTQKGLFVEVTTPDRQTGEYELDITFLIFNGAGAPLKIWISLGPLPQ